jgi:organic radical activating enzyme
MCRAPYSSKLAAIHKKINVISSDTPTLVDWTTNDQMWDDFTQNLVLNNSDLVCLHVMGGEPLYHKKFLQLIKECVAQSKTDFHVTFVTNGTIWLDELASLLPKFKSVSIEISVENLHHTNDYVRNGSNFQIVQQNILRLLQTKTQNTSIILRSVPQALSIMHYDSLIDFAIEHKLCIDSNVLVEPRELSLDVLPHTVKQNIAKHLKTKYADLLYYQQDKFSITDVRHQNNFLQQISHQIQQIIYFLSRPEPDDIEDIQIKFVRYNKNFDRLTNFTFDQCYPELVKHYEKYYNC